MSHKHNLFEEEQFVISYELLHILHWLLKYEQAEFSKLITQASIKGYEDKLKQQDMYNQIQNSDTIQYSIVNFFNFLEQQIATINTHSNQQPELTDKNIMKTLDKIDTQRFDYETIISTMQATADKLKPTNQHNSKELFLKELLKKWNPKKEKNKQIIHH